MVRSTRSLGMALLAVWLILHGVMGIVPLLVPGMGVLLSILAIAAGIFILAGR